MLKELTLEDPANNPFEAYTQRTDSQDDCRFNKVNVAFVNFLGVQQLDWIPNVNLVNKLEHTKNRSLQVDLSLNSIRKRSIPCFFGYYFIHTQNSKYWKMVL